MFNNINYSLLTSLWENGANFIRILNKKGEKIFYNVINPAVDIIEVFVMPYNKYKLMNIKNKGWLVELTIDMEREVF